jgi:hypothetical protein
MPNPGLRQEVAGSAEVVEVAGRPVLDPNSEALVNWPGSGGTAAVMTMLSSLGSVPAIWSAVMTAYASRRDHDRLAGRAAGPDRDLP